MGNLKNRTVAYLDILAFKKILKKYRPEVIGDIYKKSIDFAIQLSTEWCETFNNIYLNAEKCHCFFFSDSIIIFSPDYKKIDELTDLSGFLTVVLYVQKIVQSLLVMQIPIRGAIAFGEIYLDSRFPIFLGEGYMRALELEQSQEWIGVSIDSTIEKKFPQFFSAEKLIKSVDLFDGKKSEIYSDPSVIRYNVPLKNDNSSLLYTVNWLEKLILYDDKNKKIDNYDLINLIENSLSDIPGKEARKIYTNTREYIKYINSVFLQKEDGGEQHFVGNDKYTKILMPELN